MKKLDSNPGASVVGNPLCLFGGSSEELTRRVQRLDCRAAERSVSGRENSVVVVLRVASEE